MKIYAKIYNFKWITNVYNVLLVLMLLPSLKHRIDHTGVTAVLRSCFIMSSLLPYVMLQNAGSTRRANKSPRLVTFQEAAEGFSTIRYYDPESSHRPLNMYMQYLVGLVADTGLPPRTNIGGHFFDGGELITPGVRIDDNHILTSYSPYRNLRKEIGLKRLHAYYYGAEWFLNDTKYGYNLESTPFTCARQVVPVPESDIKEEQWHGPDHIHSPVHDLMILKTKVNMSEESSVFGKTDLINTTFKTQFQLLADVATSNDFLSDQLSFLSLEVFDNGKNGTRNYIRHVDTYGHGKVSLDCDEWFIRDWGHFLCIRNTEEDLFSVGSGAFLISMGKVIGVGSFYLKKAKDSIAVFTDIRKYSHLLNMTCSVGDGNP